MKKELFRELLNCKYEKHLVDNYNQMRSLRLVFDFDDSEKWPDALSAAHDAQEQGDTGNDSTNISFISMDGNRVYVDVSRKYEKEFNLL